MRSTIYCHAVSEGDDQEWDFGWDRYQASNVASEKMDILVALSCTNEIWLLNRLISTRNLDKKSSILFPLM